MEMEVCRQYQIPYSHFQGGPRIWDDADRAKAIAHEHFLKTICQRCGRSRSDYYDHEDQPLEEPLWAVVVRRCSGCEDMGRLEKQLPDKAREQGQFVTFIPSTDLTDDDDEAIDQLSTLEAETPSPQRLPGLS
jgi:hypothetical protein